MPELASSLLVTIVLVLAVIALIVFIVGRGRF